LPDRVTIIGASIAWRRSRAGEFLLAETASFRKLPEKEQSLHYARLVALHQQVAWGPLSSLIGNTLSA
jgi:hypothetical protein